MGHIWVLFNCVVYKYLNLFDWIVKEDYNVHKYTLMTIKEEDYELGHEWIAMVKPTTIDLAQQHARLSLSFFFSIFFY